MNETLEKLRKLASVDNNADNLWLLYLSGEGAERKETDELLDILLHQKINKDYKEKIFLDPGNKNDCIGEYQLGNVIYPDKSYASFGIRENEWIKHMLITGMTGTGKTNLCFHILRELRKKNKPFLVFDWKRNYRDLRQLPEFKDLKVYTIGSNISPFHFNPLIPPKNTNAGHWLVRLVDILKHAYFLGDGVEYLLREAMDHVYEKCGMYDLCLRYPIFSEIKVYVEAMSLRGRMSLWKASALRALASLTFSRSLGLTLEQKENEQSDIPSMLNQNVVMELDALSNNDKIFFTEALILWIYEYMKNQGKRETFKHAIIIEEGHHVLSKAKQNHEGEETIIETSLRQIREFGVSVIVIDQEPNKLSDSIKANTYCKITFNLGNGKDINDIAECMMLDNEETKYIDFLKIGNGIAKMKGRVIKPMLISFPFVSVVKGKITDNQLKPFDPMTGYPPEGVKDCEKREEG